MWSKPIALTSPQYSEMNSFFCTDSLMKVPHPATSEGASSRCWGRGSQTSDYRACVSGQGMCWMCTCAGGGQGGKNEQLLRGSENRKSANSFGSEERKNKEGRWQKEL